MSKRQERLSELIRETAAEFVQTIANNQSLLTITRADISPDVRRSTIYFTAIPESEEDKAEAFLNRHAAEFRGFAKHRLSLKRLPFFSFELDRGERHRQHLDTLEI